MNIVLIGYRCTGKSTVGRILSKKLGWNFVDTDELIEKKEGKSIEEIVSEKGWREFRRIEKEVIEEVSRYRNQVISTGGGAVLDKENRERLKKNGFIVWLRAKPETIKERMLRDKKRPSLTGKAPEEEIEEVLKEREPIYRECSDLIIDTDHICQKKIAERIIEDARKFIWKAF